MKMLKILIAEDESIIALEMSTVLSEAGHEVICIDASGQDAVKHAMELHPDLILMDLSLKGPVNGLDALNAINNSMPMPVIVTTAHSDEKTLNEVQRRKASGVLLKPFSRNELMEAIRKVSMEITSVRK